MYSTSKISITLVADCRLTEHVWLYWCVGHFSPQTIWFDVTVTSSDRIKYVICMYAIFCLIAATVYYNIKNSDIMSD
jgi:hypothetical protein